MIKKTDFIGPPQSRTMSMLTSVSIMTIHAVNLIKQLPKSYFKVLCLASKIAKSNTRLRQIVIIECKNSDWLRIQPMSESEAFGE